MKRPRLAVLLLFATAFGPAEAQTATPPSALPAHGAEISVSEVLLDVTARGRDGRAVIGLTPSDFRIEVNGHEIAAGSATFYSNRRFVGEPGGVRPPGLGNEGPGEGRTFILFFDDQRSVQVEGFSFVREQLEAGRRAAAWISTGLAPGDRAAVVAFDAKLKVYLDFTDDREALRQAVLAAAAGDDPQRDWPSRRNASDSGASSLLARLPTGTELRDRTPRIYEALQEVARAVVSVRGRKNLILFSRGFGEVGAFGTYKRDNRYYPPTREALNGSNVAVYAVNTGPEAGFVPIQGLSELASDTGGELYRNFVTYTTPLERIAAETNGYYLLSLETPSDARPGEYFEVTVRCRNPELRCSGRTGFTVAGN